MPPPVSPGLHQPLGPAVWVVPAVPRRCEDGARRGGGGQTGCLPAEASLPALAAAAAASPRHRQRLGAGRVGLVGPDLSTELQRVLGLCDTRATGTGGPLVWPRLVQLLAGRTWLLLCRRPLLASELHQGGCRTLWRRRRCRWPLHRLRWRGRFRRRRWCW